MIVKTWNVTQSHLIKQQQPLRKLTTCKSSTMSKMLVNIEKFFLKGRVNLYSKLHGSLILKINTATLNFSKTISSHYHGGKTINQEKDSDSVKLRPLLAHFINKVFFTRY